MAGIRDTTLTLNGVGAAAIRDTAVMLHGLKCLTILQVLVPQSVMTIALHTYLHVNTFRTHTFTVAATDLEHLGMLTLTTTHSVTAKHQAKLL